MGFLSAFLAIFRGAPTSPSPSTVSVSATWQQWPTLRPGGLQEVVGEQSYQSALLRVAGGRTRDGPTKTLVTAQLVREPYNRYDRNAVRVDVGGTTVGYIPAKQAPRYHSVLGQLSACGTPATCRANLTGGWDRGPDDRGSVGIVLDVDEALVPMTTDAPFLLGDRIVSATGEEHFQEALTLLFGESKGRSDTANLVGSELNPVKPKAAGPFVLVKIRDRIVGYLTPTTRDKYLPLLRKVVVAGYPSSCSCVIERGENKLEVRLFLPANVEELSGVAN